MLRTFDPFREFASDPFFRDFGGNSVNSLDYDILRSEDGVELHIDIPGIDPSTVDLTVDGRTLRLEAERTFDVPEGSQLLSGRRRSGSLQHTFQLGENLDTDNLTAEHNYGVLTVKIPMAESAKPRKVEVGAGKGGHTAIDASSSEAA